MIKRKQKKFLKYLEPIHDRFERFCRARVYGEMEGSDLMNETLLVAFEKFDKVNSEDSFFSFLCGIAVRILSNDNKRQKLADLSIEKQVKVIDINDMIYNPYGQTVDTSKLNFEVVELLSFES
ncbi:hypothetical protein OAT71_00980 [Flavobacteriales bacterium]|jgi:RNA polymerase sigma-70 factor (ECF subfamily)|nr:hypothetical protein [Flavobacteriales bacterium]